MMHNIYQNRPYQSFKLLQSLKWRQNIQKFDLVFYSRR